MSRGTGSSSEFPVQNGFLEQSGPRRRVIRMTRPRTAAERMATAVERVATAVERVATVAERTATAAERVLCGR
jgi:methyl-accepting chemotaxis protein